MKMSILKVGCLLLIAGMVTADAAAQRTPRRRTTQPTTTNPTTNPTENNQQNNNAQPSGYDPYGNLPIRVDTSGVSDTIVRKSLRPDNAFDKSSLTARTPLIYEHLRWDDALFAEKVWRELDLREKMNQVFRYEAVDDNGSQMFINMLLKAVNTGEVTAFADDRFTSPMTLGEISQLTVGKADTVAEMDVDDINKVKGYVVTRTSFDTKSVV